MQFGVTGAAATLWVVLVYDRCKDGYHQTWGELLHPHRCVLCPQASRSWSAATPVDTLATHVFFPTIDIDDAKDKVIIGFYSMTRDPTWNHRYDLQYPISSGLTLRLVFTVNTYATSTLSTGTAETFGDYFQLVIVSSRIYIGFNENYEEMGETIEQTITLDQKLRTTALTQATFRLIGVFGGQATKGAQGRAYLSLLCQCSRQTVCDLPSQENE